MPHMATTAGDEQTVKLMLKRWQDDKTGLDQAWREEYMVYLSFPDPKNPNKVTVGESTGCQMCCNESERIIIILKIQFRKVQGQKVINRQQV